MQYVRIASSTGVPLDVRAMQSTFVSPAFTVDHPAIPPNGLSFFSLAAPEIRIRLGLHIPYATECVSFLVENSIPTTY